MTDWREELSLLIARARKEGKWLYSQGLVGTFWFTPDELTAENAKGKFVWGVENWKLRDPRERLDEAINEVARCKRALDEAMKKVDELVKLIAPGVLLPPSLDQIMEMKS